MDPERTLRRVNVTLQRAFPVESHLLTFIDIPSNIERWGYIKELYPGWIIMYLWDHDPDCSRIRNELLSDNLEWNILSYECDE